MNCDIFVRSYWKDFAWLELCLRAIDRFCVGFRQVVVVVPRSSEPSLRRMSAWPRHVRLEMCRDYRDDYLGQQVTKLEADRFTDADLICHVDSDCIFARRTAPADLLLSGKPVIVRRSAELLGRHWPWREPVEKFLGWPATHDFMQRPPFVYPRSIYPELREHARRTHGRSIEEYVTAQPPRGFSEFNALGGFAHRRHRGEFAWIDGDAETIDGPCRWYWSWGDLTEQTRADIEALVS